MRLVMAFIRRWQKMEFETVKEALKFLVDEIRTNGQLATVEDVKEMVFEATVSIADLLGMSEIYLGGDPNE